MKVFLHVGYHKTGSSSIQSFLNINRQALIDKNVLYPQSFIHIYAHYGLSKLLMGHPSTEQVAGSEDIVKELIAEINNSNCDKVVFSSEYLILANKGQIEEVKGFFQNVLKASEVKVVIYLRRHDEWFESQFNQAAKTDDSPPWDIDIRDYILHILGNPAIRYLPVIEKWGNIFGNENIIVRPFETEQFHGNDLITDFLHLLGVENYGFKLKSNDVVENKSVSSGALYLLAQLRRMPKSEDRDNLIIDILKSKDLDVPFAPAGFGRLNESVRKSIVKFFSYEYGIISRRYLKRANGELFLKKFN